MRAPPMMKMQASAMSELPIPTSAKCEPLVPSFESLAVRASRGERNAEREQDDLTIRKLLS